MRAGNDEYNSVDFLAGLQCIRAKTFKLSTISSAFFNTGLWPYDPEVVLERLARFKAWES
jgi:hypothetical protein